MVYRPPTKGTRLEIPYLALVTNDDPDFQRAKHREIEYVFQRRVFVADPYRRGAYNDFSNIYDVGQPHGPVIVQDLNDGAVVTFDSTTITFDRVDITMDSAK